MKAVIIDPDPSARPVSVGDWPDPDLRPGWVLVRVSRAGLNRTDVMTVEQRSSLPGRAVIGSDGAGTVVAVGDGVAGVTVGSEVILAPGLWWGPDDQAPGPDFAMLGDAVQGTQAELVAVPAESVHLRPGRLTLDEAAALPLAGVTAWRALTTRGGLTAGQTVIVTAASSGVGTLAIQMAAALGARVVAVTSSEAKADAAVRLGAAAVVMRTSERYAEDLRDAAEPGGAHLVLDSTGAGWPALLAALRQGGRLVSVGRNAARTASVDVGTVFWQHLSILGSSVGSDRDFAAMLRHVERSTWTPVVDEVVPLAEAPAAYAAMDASTRIGKIVLALD